MEIKDVHILLLINFLHFWTYGLIVPILSGHVIQLGGNQVILGFIYGGIFIFQKISRDFLALFEHSTRLSLTFCLFVTFLCFLLAATTDSYMVLLLVRWTQGLVNSIEACSKELIVQIEPRQTHAKYFYLIDIMKTAGYVVGAIGGGYIYYYIDDFEFNALLAAISTLIALLSLQQMENVGYNQTRDSKIKQLPQLCYKKLKTLTEIDYIAHWDVLLLHITYMTSFIVFFNKFPLLLQYNYHVGVIVNGYTVAYQIMLLFASTHLIDYLKRRFKQFSLLDILDHCLLISSITLQGLYYAPTYECYLAIFIPMVITHAMVNTCLEDDLKNVHAEEQLFEATETITVILNALAPIFFGMFYHVIGGGAFKILAILPLFACMYVVNRRFLQRRTVEEVKED